MDSKFSGLPDLRTIQPGRLIKYRISDDGFAAELLLPGLTYTDFDQKIGGKMNLWSLAKLFESIRYVVLPNGFCHYNRLKDVGHSIFNAETSYHLSDKGNKLKAQTHWGTNYLMHAHLKVFYAGTSAFSFEIIVREHETGDFLAKALLTFVYVDFKTRRPATFPDWFNKLKENQHFGPPSPRLARPSIPLDAYKFEIQAAFSDIDFNGHVNNSIYIKWCTDAGTEAALKGHYSGFSENIGKYPMDVFEIKYLGEGVVSDVFEILTWQDQENPFVLHFVFTKNEKVSVVVRFQYKSLQFSAKL
ncbi:hypothetical protein MAR_020440 [Mya arenaria]|uniref:Acyl-ACP thioesterase-like C-terminal domain-containing protein n=1 Tax=Mya arenaria TaxID=6604 RepID=A0ABY7E8Z4_MYAAR|nr:uncharacterized protein LOC128234964 isoform X2 [Mya arenaria]WAR05071.1 hypothetical protein MAR_020440 [Mya arenaria]